MIYSDREQLAFNLVTILKYIMLFWTVMLYNF